MYQSIQGISIEAVACCVPKNRVENDYFEYFMSDREIKKFEKLTGIKSRRYSASTTTASDLAYEAALKILTDKKCKDDIKALIFLSQTSDYKIPFTSNILQDKLGLSKEILCLDINAGCAGFVQGLSVAYSLQATLSEGKVLLIVAETLSKILASRDKSTSMLFGDAASAVLLGRTTQVKSNAFFNFNSDGGHFEAISIPDGGYRNPVNANSFVESVDINGNSRNNTHLSMDGSAVFDFTLREIVPSLNAFASNYSLDLNRIDFFLFHQSNKFIISQLAKGLNIPMEKIPINIQEYANTSGVSIPLLMVTEKTLYDLKTPKTFALVGYGSGLNWGSCILRLNEAVSIYDLIEV